MRTRKLIETVHGCEIIYEEWILPGHKNKPIKAGEFKVVTKSGRVVKDGLSALAEARAVAAAYFESSEQ